VGGVMQVPAPLHVDSAVEALVVAAQVGSMQGVPDAHFWQAPASHLPLVPQVDCACAWQMPAGSCVPVATFVHTPSMPAMQDLHAVLQAVSQQTPCAQLPLRHSLGAEQEAPFSLRPHEFAAQVNGGTHWLFAVQALKQRVPLQMNGLHATESGATH
jgi:hypothetical protein